MEESARNKGTSQIGHCNNRAKTSHDRFKSFKADHSHTESFDKGFTVSIINMFIFRQNLHCLVLGA